MSDKGSYIIDCSEWMPVLRQMSDKGMFYLDNALNLAWHRQRNTLTLLTPYKKPVMVFP
jgi:hypothetical protein